jgi:hypothetical protein
MWAFCQQDLMCETCAAALQISIFWDVTLFVLPDFPKERDNVVPSSSRVKQSNMNSSWTACSLNTRKHPTAQRHIPEDQNPQYLM